MSIIARIRAYLNNAIEHDETLDHVPVSSPQSMNAIKFQRAREEAREKHGRPFLADTHVPRDTKPSYALKKIAAASKVAPEPEVGNVTQMRRNANQKD